MDYADGQYNPWETNNSSTPNNTNSNWGAHFPQPQYNPWEGGGGWPNSSHTVGSTWGANVTNRPMQPRHRVRDVITTEEELQEFQIVQTVLRDLVRYWMPLIPRNNVPHQGEAYMAYLFNGHPEGFKDALRMRKPIYINLVDDLVRHGFLQYGANASVGPYESFAIFIQTCAMHHHFRDTQGRFQHSSETVHRHFIKVLNALLQFAEVMIVPPDFNVTHSRIASDPHFYPYFKNCVGAIDGTHIPAFIQKKFQLPWRNRKKQLSQNVLAICDFDATFTYVCSGWEGSAHDTRVLNYAHANDTRFPHPPPGKFYLVDSGYTNCEGYLSPYRNTAHHLPEWGPRTASGPIELYNKRHAQLRNVIERAFGILKRRFPIFEQMLSYDVEIQVDLVRACCAINNYILRSDLDDLFKNAIPEAVTTTELNLGANEGVGAQPSQASMAAMSQFRDQLATQLWNDR